MKERPNLNYIKEIASGNTEFEYRFLEIIYQELPRERRAYNSFVSEQDYEEASRVVHKIKHKLGVLNMPLGYELARQYEEALRDGSPALKPEFDRVLEVAEEFINNWASHENHYRR